MFISAKPLKIEVSGSERNLCRENRPIFRSNRNANAHDAHRSARPQSKIQLVPGMYASVKIPLHTAANVLTRSDSGSAIDKEGSGTVLVVNTHNHSRAARRQAGIANRDASGNTIRPAGKRTVIFGEQAQFKVGELVSPETSCCSGNGVE